MRGAGVVLGGMSPEQAEPFWAHMSAYKPPKALKWAIVGKGGPRGLRGEELQGRGAGGVPGGMSLERGKRARKGFEGGIREEVAGIVLGVPNMHLYSAP